MSSSRRTFLHQLSAAAAVGAMAPIRDRGLWTAAPSTWLADPDEALLVELALKAIDAARAGGATFADVRLTMTQSISLMSFVDMAGVMFSKDIKKTKPTMFPPGKGSSARYDVRALIDGGWGFCADDELNADAVVNAARRATLVARANKPLHRTSLDLAPAPIVKSGRWTTPIELDPFAVPLRDQGQMQLDAIGGALDIAGMQNVALSFGWTRGLEVFASTDGSLIIQRPRFGSCAGSVGANVDNTVVNNFINHLAPNTLGHGIGGYGFEIVGEQAALTQKVVRTVTESVELAKQTKNAVTADVGRYDIIFGPEAMAAALAATVFPALNLERVLGYRANDEGTSFAAPPADMLGKFKLGSPLLTVRGNRTEPNGVSTIGWDAEGVKPEDHVLVKDGIIHDYCTGRQTAAELAGVYAKRGQPLRSNGCTQSSELGPAIRAPNLTMDPGPGTTTLDELVSGIKRGYYIENGGGSSDQQLLNTQFYGAPWVIRQITNGKLGPYVKEFAVQFVTPSFWKSLDGVGGAPSVKRTVVINVDPTIRQATLHVVPARFRQLNVLNTGRRA